MNRVVVTGLGVVSPVGNDVESFWHALCTGTCGIGPITRFDTTDFKVKIAGEVRNFDPKQYMDKLDILHSDIYTQFAMAAACQAMFDSRLASEIDPERIGVYIGTGIGGIATFMAEHQKLLERGPRRVSPFFIPRHDRRRCGSDRQRAGRGRLLQHAGALRLVRPVSGLAAL